MIVRLVLYLSSSFLNTKCYCTAILEYKHLISFLIISLNIRNSELFHINAEKIVFVFLVVWKTSLTGNLGLMFLTMKQGWAKIVWQR